MRKELEVIIRRREITEEDYGDIRTEGKRNIRRWEMNGRRENEKIRKEEEEKNRRRG